MTQKELDIKIYEIKSFVSDKFRDIQMQSQALKNVEDETKIMQTLTKISDFITEIKRGYDTFNSLIREDVEEEEEDNTYDICNIFDDLK